MCTPPRRSPSSSWACGRFCLWSAASSIPWLTGGHLYNQSPPPEPHSCPRGGPPSGPHKRHPHLGPLPEPSPRPCVAREEGRPTSTPLLSHPKKAPGPHPPSIPFAPRTSSSAPEDSTPRRWDTHSRSPTESSASDAHPLCQTSTHSPDGLHGDWTTFPSRSPHPVPACLVPTGLPSLHHRPQGHPMALAPPESPAQHPLCPGHPDAPEEAGGGSPSLASTPLLRPHAVAERRPPSSQAIAGVR